MPDDTLRNARPCLFCQTGHPRPVPDRAEGICMWETGGNRFIDGSCGTMVCNIGHSNPAVPAAMRAQMDRSTFGCRLYFVTQAAEALAARTAALAWPGMDRVFFVPGGPDAVESAIQPARHYAIAIALGTRWTVILRSPSSHGCTLGARAITGYGPLTDPFVPLIQKMPKVRRSAGRPGKRTAPCRPPPPRPTHPPLP